MSEITIHITLWSDAATHAGAFRARSTRPGVDYVPHLMFRGHRPMQWATNPARFRADTEIISLLPPGSIVTLDIESEHLRDATGSMATNAAIAVGQIKRVKRVFPLVSFGIYGMQWMARSSNEDDLLHLRALWRAVDYIAASVYPDVPIANGNDLRTWTADLLAAWHDQTDTTIIPLTRGVVGSQSAPDAVITIDQHEAQLRAIQPLSSDILHWAAATENSVRNVVEGMSNFITAIERVYPIPTEPI